MITHSERLPRDLVPNRLSEALARRRARGAPIADLTESNPTRAGLAYPRDLLAPLSDPAALAYDPQPFGLASARAAVVADYARRGVATDVDRVCLTASTSEAYAWLFKLVCNAGDRVLVPRPSYPLFEHLTALECVEASPHELDPHAHWRLDLEALRRQIDERTRAVLVVSPNNPTGSVVEHGELEALATICAAHGLVLIGDEVFADYRLDGLDATSVLAQDVAPAVSLGGLSKSAGLPQIKVAWMAIGGPEADAAQLMTGLEIVADTFLSVSTPAQVALPHLFARGAEVRDQIRRRTVRNLDALAEVVAATPQVTLQRPAGGWCAVLQVPSTCSEETLVLELLEQDGVLVHPGYFFDFPREAYLVVSLMTAPDVFDAALPRVLARVTEAA